MENRYEIDNVMKYFYDISKIPRMSGKEEKIADYAEKFAKERNLKYIRDEYNNIIITKESSKKCKNDESLLLQCHMDMVCEKIKGSNHNFENDPIEIYIEDDYIRAKGTTLGADNGIGVAIILAILDSKIIKHPRIEAIFTVQEETTMEGAQKIDVSTLKGNKMICLDNMREEELLIGCASAKVFDFEIPCNKEKLKEEYKLIRIEMDGFIGGHSGNDISKNRGNSIEEIGKLLFILNSKYNIYLKDIIGGKKVNVIPRDCYCDLYVKFDDLETIKKEINNFKTLLKNKFADDNDVNVIIEMMEEENGDSFDKESTEMIINIINSIPNGVYYEDKNKNPLVSLNMGLIFEENDNIHLLFSIRSNRELIENELINKIDRVIKKYNINSNISQLPGYEHKEKSLFIDECKNIYEQCLNKKPKVIDMHICLEAGFFGEKIENLDFIAIAPNILDAHSPNERCSVSSLNRIYNYVLTILEKL